jgi:hypothetical protein
MSRRALRGLIVGTIVLFAGAANRAEADGGSQSPALRRVAKQIGVALDRHNRSDVRVVLGPQVTGEIAELILVRCKEAFVADARIETVTDEASFTAQIDYVRSDLKVCLEVVLKDGNNQTLGKFAANFDLELPAESEIARN